MSASSAAPTLAKPSLCPKIIKNLKLKTDVKVKVVHPQIIRTYQCAKKERCFFRTYKKTTQKDLFATLNSELKRFTLWLYARIELAVHQKLS